MKLNDYGREISSTQNSNEWVLMSDVPSWAYAIAKPDVFGGSTDMNAKDLMEESYIVHANTQRIAKKIKEYYSLALNLDYRTITRQFYYSQSYDLISHNGYLPTTVFYNLADHVKENKLIVEGYAFPDMSTIYVENGITLVRTKFKFRVISGNTSKGFNMDSFDVSNKSVAPTFVQKGKWYYGYGDVHVQSIDMNDPIGGSKVRSSENMFLKNNHVYKEL